MTVFAIPKTCYPPQKLYLPSRDVHLSVEFLHLPTGDGHLFTGDKEFYSVILHINEGVSCDVSILRRQSTNLSCSPKTRDSLRKNLKTAEGTCQT